MAFNIWQSLLPPEYRAVVNNPSMYTVYRELECLVNSGASKITSKQT